MKFRALLAGLFLSLAAGRAAAQSADLVPYEDVYYLQEGGFLRGRVVADDGETLRIREAGKVSVREMPRSRVIRTKTKVEVYLEEGRTALDKGDLDLALSYFRHLVDQLAEGSPERARADLGVESVY
mgnify:CR=1 FL=1